LDEPIAEIQRPSRRRDDFLGRHLFLELLHDSGERQSALSVTGQPTREGAWKSGASATQANASIRRPWPVLLRQCRACNVLTITQLLASRYGPEPACAILITAADGRLCDSGLPQSSDDGLAQRLSDRRREGVADLAVSGCLAPENCQESGNPCSRATMRTVTLGSPSSGKAGPGSWSAMPRPSTLKYAHAARARVRPRSGPPCFLLPPTMVEAIALGRFAHALAPWPSL